MEDWKAKEAARKVAADALAAANPGMVRVSGAKGCDSLNAAAKNIRFELKAAFPGIKFSVKTSRFSGGDSIDVRWTDGPTRDQVDPIIGKYSAGSFDGMQDLYTYERCAWTDAFGDAKYVRSSRDNSDKALASAIRTVKAKYAGNLSALGLADIDPADYRAGKLWNVDLLNSGGMDHWSLQSVIGRTMAARTWALAKVAVRVEMEEGAAA